VNAEYVIYAVVIAVAVAVLAAVLVGIVAPSFGSCSDSLRSRASSSTSSPTNRPAISSGVPVLEVAYFRFDDPPGYVQHVTPERYRASFVVSVAPFLVNTVVAFAAFLGLTALVTTVGDLRTVSNGTIAAATVLGWLGLSIGMHAFPSRGTRTFSGLGRAPSGGGRRGCYSVFRSSS